jgi:hypothetical protein
MKQNVSLCEMLVIIITGPEIEKTRQTWCIYRWGPCCRWSLRRHTFGCQRYSTRIPRHYGYPKNLRWETADTTYLQGPAPETATLKAGCWFQAMSKEVSIGIIRQGWDNWNWNMKPPTASLVVPCNHSCRWNPQLWWNGQISLVLKDLKWS